MSKYVFPEAKLVEVSKARKGAREKETAWIVIVLVEVELALAEIGKGHVQVVPLTPIALQFDLLERITIYLET